MKMNLLKFLLLNFRVHRASDNRYNVYYEHQTITKHTINCRLRKFLFTRFVKEHCAKGVSQVHLFFDQLDDSTLNTKQFEHHRCYLSSNATNIHEHTEFRFFFFLSFFFHLFLPAKLSLSYQSLLS